MPMPSYSIAGISGDVFSVEVFIVGQLERGTSPRRTTERHTRQLFKFWLPLVKTDGRTRE